MLRPLYSNIYGGINRGGHPRLGLDGFSVEGLSGAHPTPSLAFRFLYKGKTVVYSGDTSFCPELAVFAADADLFLLECASTRAQAFEGHLTPDVALATLEASGCKMGVLTHLSDQTAAELRKATAHTRFSIASDLQRIRL